MKIGPRPTCAATAPIAGPTTMPIRAAPTAPPITDPRLPWAVVLVSQASAPAHATAPPKPWRSLAASSVTPDVPHAKPIVAIVSSPMPASAVTLTPRRSTIAIDGTAPSTTPAG